jgi:hypothetical protein
MVSAFSKQTNGALRLNFQHSVLESAINSFFKRIWRKFQFTYYTTVANSYSQALMMKKSYLVPVGDTLVFRWVPLLVWLSEPLLWCAAISSKALPLENFSSRSLASIAARSDRFFVRSAHFVAFAKNLPIASLACASEELQSRKELLHWREQFKSNVGLKRGHSFRALVMGTDRCKCVAILPLLERRKSVNQQ